ncbi:MAG: HD domain-containing protein, partial [Smithellaceae bacterium]
LLEKFFKTVRDIRLSLLSFLEKDLSGKSIWRDVRRRMSRVDIGPGIALLDGIIFPGSRRALHLSHPEAVLTVFKQSLACQGTLSVELRNLIRHSLEAMPAGEFKSARAGNLFNEILAWPGRVGPTFLLMHETGLLSRMIPPFSSLTCKVEYDSYHEFTVDQHTLLAVCACDDLIQDEDPKIRSLYAELTDKRLLRLAVLLHDIGKAMPGDHAQNGAVMAEAIALRLGLSDDQIARIRFLVRHHLDLSDLSLLRDFDNHNLTVFAADVGDVDTLNLLYLLTIVDIRSVGHHTWSGWKAYQLDEIYDRLVGLLREGRCRREDAPVRQNLESDGFAETENCVPLSEEDIVLQQVLFAGFERLTVCARDRVGFLSDMIGCITSEGYNILSAKIHSSPAGGIRDVFYLEAPEKPRIAPQKRMENIRRKWRLIAGAHTDADTLVQDRLKKYPLPLVRAIAGQTAVTVRINNQDSAAATIVEISTADNFGLLHRIARCFFENRINIVAAKLSTRNDQACDVFYVTDAARNKITEDGKTRRLTDGLKKRLRHEKQETE